MNAGQSSFCNNVILCCITPTGNMSYVETDTLPAGASSASLRAATCGSRSASDSIVKELSAPTKPTVQLLAFKSPSVMLAEIACIHDKALQQSTWYVRPSTITYCLKVHQHKQPHLIDNDKLLVRRWPDYVVLGLPGCLFQGSHEYTMPSA